MTDAAPSPLSPPLRELIETGPLAHVVTLNPDGSAQVSVVWIGLDGDELVSGHMFWHRKLRNVARDPRVVISLEAPPRPGLFLAEHAVVHGRARVEEGGARELLQRLAKTYLTPEMDFTPPPGEGWVLRTTVERVGGMGPWAG